MRRPNAFVTFLVQLKELITDRTKRPGGGEDVPAKDRRRPDFGRTVLAVAMEGLAIAFLIGVVLAFVLPVLRMPGYAPGSDTPSHMYVVRRLADGLKANGRLPAIDLFWYSGLEITHKLPLVPYIPMLVVYLMTNNDMLTSKIVFICLLVLLSLSTYIMMRFRYPRLNSLGAAIVVSFSATVFSPNYGVLGSFTRIFAYIFFPLALYATVRLIDGRRAYIYVLAIILSLTFPSHPMVAILTIMWTGVYAGLRLILEHRSILEIRYFIYSVLLASLLAAWYLVPYVFEEPVWGTSLPADILPLYSMPLRPQIQHLGVIFAFLVIASITFKYSPARMALLLAGLFGFVYALGPFGPLFKIAPMLGFAYPFLAYFASFIGLTYLIFSSASLNDIGGAGPQKYVLRAVGGLVAAILTAGIVFQAYTFANFNSFQTRKFSEDEIALSGVLRRQGLPGRVMPIGRNYGLIVHALPRLAKKPSPEGQFAAIAPFYLEITRIYDDLKKGYLTAAREKLRRWNANFVLLLPDLKERKDLKGQRFAQVLEAGGFRRIYKNSSYTLYRQSRPASYIQPIPERVLVIGRFAPIVTALYPKSIATQESNSIDDYTLEELRLFDALVLTGFTYRNQASAERLLRAYIKQGGTLLIDMQALDEYTYERNKEFFGVRVKRKKVRGRIDFTVRRSGQIFVSGLRPLKFPRTWRTLYYTSLSRTLIEARSRGRAYPVVGYKTIGKGRAYFIGANLTYYGFNKHRADIAALIDRLLAVPLTKRPAPVGERTDLIKFTPEKMIFKYRADKAWPALISRTYSPHWRAFLSGGRELKIIKTEGLMQIDLPRGRHTVTLRYGPTFIHLGAKIVTVMAWVISIYMIFRWRNLDIKDVVNHRRERTSYI